jgi:hypothetical protein
MSQILNRPEKTERVAVLEYLLEVGNHLLGLRDFASLFDLYLSLLHPGNTRL